MNQFTILVCLAALTVFGLAQRATAQAVPNVVGMKAFSVEAQYMSLAGYLRWQVLRESNVWISHEEAGELVRSQVPSSK